MEIGYYREQNLIQLTPAMSKEDTFAMYGTVDEWIRAYNTLMDEYDQKGILRAQMPSGKL